MKRFLLFLCLVLMPTAATAQWNYASKAASDSLALALLKTSVDDSLLNYGVRPRLNAKTAFNLWNIAGIDTLQSWKDSLKRTVAWMDSTGKLTTKMVQSDSMKVSNTGTSANWLLMVYKNGVRKASVDSSGNGYLRNNIYVGGQFLPSTVNNVAAPVYSSNGDSDTGIYFPLNYSNQVGIAAKGANVATFDSAGVTVAETLSAKVAKADTFKANYAVLWGPNLADYTVVNTDSVASAGAANDTTGTRVYWRRYFSWDSAESPSMKTGIYSTVFHLGTETRYKPDSLVVNLWFDGTHANADSGAAMIVVKGQSGTIVSTGWVTVAAASTWEHKGYVIPTPFTRNEEYEILVYTKSVSGGRWCWSPPRFK